ncbi:phosphatases II [Hesseltinella vesiculosa]|uniref:protein-tyrosine-phosphatase n=1 Tax=Hesseltinella vesiculosa TaxID=101127 RepID=A0A1X2GHR4_9FUNG|nr:phosphatases II [Hesseltinella vesiculosa]
MHSLGFHINPPTFIETAKARFLIVDAPSNNNLPFYIKEFERWQVTDVVRCCEATYSMDKLKEKGIKTHDIVFSDGASPPDSIIQAWLKVIDDCCDQKNNGCIAIHCVAGLGRAPVLVAIALVEEGMPPLDAVAYIRERRRGAINKQQLKFIEAYRPRSKKQCIIS